VTAEKPVADGAGHGEAEDAPGDAERPKPGESSEAGEKGGRGGVVLGRGGDEEEAGADGECGNGEDEEGGDKGEAEEEKGGVKEKDLSAEFDDVDGATDTGAPVVDDLGSCGRQDETGEAEPAEPACVWVGRWA
jgi:hypothetical protein